MTVWADIEADYHQFFVAAVDVDPSTVDGEDELINASSNVVVVRTGIATGPVSVGLSRLPSEPVELLGDWEDVGQADLEATLPLVVMTNFGVVSGDHEPVSPPTTGWLSVRVSANGRQVQPDAIVDESFERCLIEVWPIDGPTAAEPVDQLKSVVPVRKMRDELFATDATVRRRGPVAWDPEG